MLEEIKDLDLLSTCHADEDKFHAECGVFGIFLNDSEDDCEAARTTFYGLYALQHRGRECGYSCFQWSWRYNCIKAWADN